MFENPRKGRQAKNFTTNVSKILDLKSSSEQIFSENCRWVPLCKDSPAAATFAQRLLHESENVRIIDGGMLLHEPVLYKKLKGKQWLIFSQSASIPPYVIKI